MKKKFTKALALGLSLATALTLTTGCGKKEDTTSDTPVPAVTSESSSDNSRSETAAGTIDYTICPWVFSRALSDEETLELPEGAGLYGLTACHLQMHWMNLHIPYHFMRIVTPFPS